MATITEDYISFETAKLLKEKGFNEYCPLWYNLDKPIEGPFFYKEIGWYGHNSYDYNGKRIVSAPTIQMAMKWLREVYKIHIIAEPCLGERNEPNLSFNRWFWTILKEEGEYEPIRKIEEFSTYEEAIEAAIKYCLDNLI